MPPIPDPIIAPTLAAAANIRHGFFTRAGGVSSGIYAGLNCGFGSNDDPAMVRENRRRVGETLGADSGQVVTVYQVHSADAVIISTPPPRDALPRADAVISNKPGLAIGVLTADCGPVLMADPDAGVVAAVHAGWRGAVGGVLASALAEMERLGADRHRIVAAIGPCISQSAYEVGDDFTTAVTRADPESAAFLAVPNGKVKNHFDLPGYIEAKLRELNINRIDNVAACTHGNESLFFSYRRATQRQEPDYGRQISAIVVA